MNRKKPLLAVIAAVLLAGFAIAHAVRPATLPGPADESASEPAVPEGAAERLAGALRIPTISSEDPAAFDTEAFRAFHAYLQAQFPRVHSYLRREVVATNSLLYTWGGSDSSLKPILLMGHLDVVPVESGTEKDWQWAPFTGRIDNGFIWGRGAIDNKSAVVGTLEAVEMLLAEGFRPARTVYFAYGHDEEIGGTRGAQEIAALLKGRGVELEMVLDEGGIVSDGIFPGITEPVALIGIAEKGFASIELTTRVAGGHSSLPPRQSAIGILGAAVARLEENPLPARLDGPTEELFNRIGPRFSFIQRVVFANLWFTRPLVMQKLSGNPTTNAMIRTTTAATIFQAGTKDNVLPSVARAVINFRISPGDSVDSVLDHVRNVIDDTRVEVRIAGRFSAEPSAISGTDSESFRKLEHTIQIVLPEAIVAPYLVVVSTDARYYAGLSRSVFRFLPLRLTPEDIARMHGVNERLEIRNYESSIRFYRQILLDMGGQLSPHFHAE